MKNLLIVATMLLSANVFAAHGDRFCLYKGNLTQSVRVDDFRSIAGANSAEQKATQLTNLMTSYPDYNSYEFHDDPDFVCATIERDLDCSTGENESCTAGTTNTASHILDIEMGGYEDGLYVCAVEIVGHDCKLDDAKANADFIEVGNINYGKKWEIAADDIPELGVVDNGHSASAKLHLNSFRYGTKYKVTYCYDFKRVVTSWSSLGEEYQPEINQQGALTGLVKFTLGDGNYFDVAGLSAELSYSCADDEGDITGDDFNDWSTLVAGATHTLSITELLFDLGRNLEGSCRFTAKFVEGNVGDIRPLTDLDKTHVGVINTNASANMELIQN